MLRIVVFLVLAVLLGVAAWLMQRPSLTEEAGPAAEQAIANSGMAGGGQSETPVSATGVAPDTQTETTMGPASAESQPDVRQACEDAEPLNAAKIISDLDTEMLAEQYEERRRSAGKRLSVSTESEHLMIAAMQEEDAAARLHNIERALEISPDSAVILWTAAHICVRAGESHACPLDQWLQRLLDVDSSNTESWMLAATSYYQAGDPESALDALRQAANAPETNIFWADVVEIAERSLAAAGDMPFPERVSMAFGTSASGGPNYTRYIEMCKERSAVDSEWASLCFAYGERAEQQSRTALGAGIARAVQSVALRALGEAEKLEAVTARREAYRQKRQENLNHIPGLHLLSPMLFHTYLDAIRRVGEDEAQEVLIAEARRLFSQQPAAECEDG